MKKEKNEMTEQEEEELRKNPVNNFLCTTCKNSEVMNFKEFKDHLLTVHKLNSDQMKGTKQMVMHLDAAQWFSYSYEWTLESGLKFNQFTQHARSKDDMMRF